MTTYRNRRYVSSFSLASTTPLETIPPKLADMVSSLATVSDSKLKYQQLLYLSTSLQPMPSALKIQENKVPGCLSTVHIHGILKEDNTVWYMGDSDAQLTKGLVALLVNGLSGSSPQVIERIQPDFITYSGISASLTPGRNNGFLNMLKVMKKKAKELELMSTDSETPPPVNAVESTLSVRPIYESIVKKLSMLRPVELVVEDDSSRHAGHAGVSSSRTETHFNVRVVSSSFQGLSLVQRHKMIYTLLAQEMAGDRGIHALSIDAKTPEEVVPIK